MLIITELFQATPIKLVVAGLGGGLGGFQKVAAKSPWEKKGESKEEGRGADPGKRSKYTCPCSGVSEQGQEIAGRKPTQSERGVPRTPKSRPNL